MKSTQTPTGWMIRLELGEELVQKLTEFCEQNSVEAGWISGIGGATKARVGYYNLSRKKYIFRSVKDVRELVSLQGNVSRIGDKVALHLHGVVTDSNNKPRGGHINELIVGGTCEVYIQTFDKSLQRQIDPEIGLPLLTLED
ncbi:TPA: DNA-binding protein [Candidatus Saccharibacteria bacterium]|nr:DNA-binding protein [Candidatus Saccharibacteria bacterium]HIO88056.1 DNA-binding protein [Candidatus Saccharibacteria bacterium]